MLYELQEEKCRRRCKGTAFVVNSAWETDELYFLILDDPASDNCCSGRYEPKVPVVVTYKNAEGPDDIYCSDWFSLSMLENDPTVREISNEKFFFMSSCACRKIIPGYDNFICCFVDDEEGSTECETDSLVFTSADYIGEPDGENTFKEKFKEKCNQLKNWLHNN